MRRLWIWFWWGGGRAPVTAVTEFDVRFTVVQSHDVQFTVVQSYDAKFVRR